MGAEDFLQDPQIRGWLDGVEPAWTLLTFESLRALRHEPSAVQTAIRIANDLSVGETAASPVARNTLILLRQAIERGGKEQRYDDRPQNFRCRLGVSRCCAGA